MQHRILPESPMPLENIRVALAGAEFHSEQICTGRAALMRPFLIPALGAELGAWIRGRAGLIMALIADTGAAGTGR